MLIRWKMSRTKMALYNSASTATMQIVTMIVGFAIPRIMLETYGSEINGLISSICQFIAYFNLVEAGLAGATIYALYKPLAENDHKEISAVVSAAKRFYILSGYIFVALTLGLALIYPIFIKTSALSSIEVGLLVLVLGVSGAIEFFTMAKYRTLLTADQKTYILSLASTVAIIINVIIIVVLASFKVNIVVLRIAVLSSIFVRSFILYIYVKLNYNYINFKEKPNNAALNKRWDALYLQIAGVVHTSSPIVLATIFTSLKMVSVYAIFNIIVEGVCAIIGIFTTGLAASFGEVIAKREIIILQKAYREFELFFYALMTIAFSVTMVTIMPFIRIYTRGITDMNYDLPLIASLLVANSFIGYVRTPQGMIVISAGMYKETKVQATIQGATTIILGAILAPSLGLAGILIGSIVSNLYRNIDLLFFVPHNITKLPVQDTFFRQCRIFIAATIIWAPFYFINVNPQSYLMWFVFVIIVGIYSVIVVVILGFIFDRIEMKNIYRRITSIWG